MPVLISHVVQLCGLAMAAIDSHDMLHLVTAGPEGGVAQGHEGDRRPQEENRGSGEPKLPIAPADPCWACMHTSRSHCAGQCCTCIVPVLVTQ